MKGRIVKTPKEVLEALPEETLQGVFEDLAELVERYFAKQGQDEQIEVRSAAKRSRRPRGRAGERR
jgi:hypothetical protein